MTMGRAVILYVLLSNIWCNPVLPTAMDWPFLPQLQQLCPYTSFCEHNASLSLPDNEKRRLCCEHCSCEPGCDDYGNCCFDDVGNGESERIVKCTSPVISKTKIATIRYVMMHLCSSAANNSPCVVNYTDYASFAPVTSLQTGVIYVNAECAFCNDDHDFVPWQIAIGCPQYTKDHSFDTLKLIQGDDVGPTGCHMTYVPPRDQSLNVESRECMSDIIRECNVTGRMESREPFWDYCPMFNATYSHRVNIYYGNIFCFLFYHKVWTTECVGSDRDIKALTSPFSAILDLTILEGIKTVEDIGDDNKCDHVTTGEQSIKCRRSVCPMGKIRVGGRCGFYSKEWIGGPFTVVLKLTPQNGMMGKWFQTDIPTDVKHDLKATWLKRNAMKAWNIRTLYRPSKEGIYAEYLLAFATYPSSTVNPTRLEKILRRTLNETWVVNTTLTSYYMSVEFNRYENYERVPKELMGSVECAKINEDYAFIVQNYDYADNLDKYMLPVYFPGMENIWSDSTVFLNKLFLCDQVQLFPHEFRIQATVELLIVGTNRTLYDTEYRIIESGHVSVCANVFSYNTGSKMRYSYIMVLILLCCLFLNE